MLLCRVIRGEPRNLKAREEGAETSGLGRAEELGGTEKERRAKTRRCVGRCLLCLGC